MIHLANEPVTPLLAIADLRVEFQLARSGLFGERHMLKAVDGVSFQIAPTETLGIVGESGCGKSTLARAALRLIEPASGSILWNGEDFLALDDDALRRARRGLQIIFQDPLASLDPRMTVRQAIEQPLLNFDAVPGSGERQRLVAQVMTEVGLPPAWMDRYPHEFSGGQCQRIGIARALILKPKLIVCDEPVSALDVSIQAQIINLLMAIQAERGLSLMFISHNLSVVRHISHRIMVLYLGQVVETATRDAFYARPLHPYSQALIAAVPVPDPAIERTKPRLRLTGDIPSPANPPSGCRFRTRCPHADALCAAEPPPLRDFGGGHLAACHYVERWL